jgi:hypothetical protein
MLLPLLFPCIMLVPPPELLEINTVPNSSLDTLTSPPAPLTITAPPSEPELLPLPTTTSTDTPTAVEPDSPNTAPDTPVSGEKELYTDTAPLPNSPAPLDTDMLLAPP